MATSAYNRRKGPDFERQIADHFALFYPDADRRTKNGAKDRGDLLLPGERRYTVEIKNRATLALPEWIRQAEVEAANNGTPFGVVVHKRKGKGQPEEQFVTMTLSTFIGLVVEKAE